MEGQRQATVLVVDDEPQVLILLERLLTDAGYRVVTASRADEALRVFAQSMSPIDLILSDVVMPQFGGHELVLRVRELYPATKAMLMTGYSGGTLSDVPLLRKPFTSRQVLTTIADLLGQPAERQGRTEGVTDPH